MANSQSKISTAIETSREELLDLGLRNPLLNYRPSRARGVEVVDELPAEVFRVLIREGRPMSFEAALQLVIMSSFQGLTDGQWCTVRSLASSGCAELCSLGLESLTPTLTPTGAVVCDTHRTPGMPLDREIGLSKRNSRTGRHPAIIRLSP